MLQPSVVARCVWEFPSDGDRTHFSFAASAQVIKQQARGLDLDEGDRLYPALTSQALPQAQRLTPRPNRALFVTGTSGGVDPSWDGPALPPR